jgi:hypothetical protein
MYAHGANIGCALPLRKAIVRGGGAFLLQCVELAPQIR